MKRIFIFFIIVLFCSVPVLYSETGDIPLKRTYIIPIEGEIDRALTVFIQRGIQKAKDNGAERIVFEIDTFGGRVDSALQITTLIGSVQEITTIAYIPASPASTGVSWSAGALISLSCDAIYMAPGTSMGAAAPVYAGSQGMMEEAPEKTVSAVRTQMAAIAEKNGYSKAVALAMVDADVELLEVYLGDTRIIASRDDMPDLLRESEEKNLELREGRIISKSGKLLTLTAMEMEDYGLSSGTVADTSLLLETLGIDPDAGVERLEPSSPDRLIALLTSTVATTLLVMAGLAALYLEITSPGFGVPGTIAIIAFLIIFMGSTMLGTVGSLEILLFIAGVILLVLEIFLIPGFGVAGISGILLIVFSLALSRQDFIIPEFQWQKEIFRDNLLSVGIGLIASIGILGLLMRFFQRAPFFNRLILQESQESSRGFQVQPQNLETSLMGSKGSAATSLRPAGKAEFNGEIIPVETEGDFLEKGTAVEIVEISGNRIIVREAADAD